MSLSAVVRTALLSVLREEGVSVDGIPSSLPEQRKLLGDVLIASSSTWKETTLQLLDLIWSEESRSRESSNISLKGLKPTVIYKGTELVVWQGDITKLSDVDAIVNAANDQGLGCFVPQHKCIDNIVHRRAGPRLRLACSQQVKGRTLAVGTTPLYTQGFSLPSSNIIHVTGPYIPKGRAVTEEDKLKLSTTYTNVLDLAVHHKLRSLAFPCISTGLFGFPQDEAAAVVLGTVRRWIEENPNKLKTIVFDTFTDIDLKLYAIGIQKIFVEVSSVDDSNGMALCDDPQFNAVQLASAWVKKADRVLIVAGAGMSVKEGEMVYVNSDDFAFHYPWFTKWGYRTCYETMGLMYDTSVPETAKWAFQAKHMDNMRWTFSPNRGYELLKQMVKDKDYFVLTSNVDGCFERSGFDKDRIYTPQGEWTYLQCTKPCRHDSVFLSRPVLDTILPRISNDGFIAPDIVPRRPRCGSAVFGNVRGGSWFLHEKYESQNMALQDWMQKAVDDTHGGTVAVIEIGAGFNTPTVTRFPAEAFARALGDRGRFIRINPSDPQVSGNLRAVSFADGWKVLEEIASRVEIDFDESGLLEPKVRVEQEAAGLLLPEEVSKYISNQFGKDGWRQLLDQLRSST